MKPWIEHLYIATFVLAAVVGGLVGCADISLSTVARDASGSGQGPYVRVELDQGLVTVSRQGRTLPQATSRLQVGDEVETGPDSVALILFRDLGEVMLLPNTRVPIGSIEVFFGEVLARVKGLFTASSQNVVAAVQGTSFSLTSKNGAVRVVVAEGVVQVSPRGAGWSAQRLGAGQAITVSGGCDARVGSASGFEMARLRTRFDVLRQAPRQGFCCVGGSVQPGQSDQCPSSMFGRTADDTQRACRAAETGYCCKAGKVTSGTAGDCRADQFFRDLQLANQNCKAVPDGAREVPQRPMPVKVN